MFNNKHKIIIVCKVRSETEREREQDLVRDGEFCICNPAFEKALKPQVFFGLIGQKLSSFILMYSNLNAIVLCL